MRRVLLLFVAAGCLGTAALLSVARSDKPADSTEPKFNLKADDKNPWTSLAPNVSAEQFRFAVVSDRTGGHRKGVFSRAVQQVNLMQPEFVMSVGDLIEGGKTAEVSRKQWDDFDRYAKQFAMPFFFCPGNHDADTVSKADVWKERLGKAYYHFLYKGCLFLILNSNDQPATALGRLGNGIGKDQIAYVEKTLKENDKVRWTFVFVHHPLWAARDVPATNWLDVEKPLAGRKHTVFCGHVHTFRKYLRNGSSYYQLATTGGSSAMRGLDYGEFDQIAWVTMNTQEPVIAQLALSGIMKDDLSPIETNEDGSQFARIEGLVEVTGTAMLNDKPAAGIQVNFTAIRAEGDPEPPAPERTPTSPPSGRIGADGAFTVYQYRGAAGLKPGRYAVTFDLAPTLIVTEKKPDNPVPEKYRTVTKTPFRVEVKADGRNRFEFKLEE
jgi:hypothetical protein